MVEDTLTGLMWQGCSAGLSGEDCAVGTTVQSTWSGALSYYDGLSWAGHDDWRLPNLNELSSIVDDRVVYPSIDMTAFPATFYGFYWSSSSGADDVTAAWSMDFGDGEADPHNKGIEDSAQCVRGGP